MALQIPGYSVPAPYAQNPDIIGQFGKGYDFSRGIVNENEAKQALGEYVKSLYAGGAPQGAPAPAASSNPIDALIGADHSAASGATDPTLTAYFDKLGQSESGGDPNAKNPNSSATGLYQITDGTWNGLMQAHPELGLTQDGRTDPNQQQKAVRVLTADNAGALKSAGQPINPATLYAAHFLGAPTATSVLGYADNTPMTAAVPPEVLQANPQLQNMTVGDFKTWAGQQGGNGQGGYRPPMMQPQGGPGGLPPEAVLADLFANPNTRDFAAGITKTRTDPMAAANLASTEADINLKNAQAGAWSNGLKTGGYIPGPNGTLTYAPGGRADPNNPLNVNKVAPVGADGSSLGTTGVSAIDPTVPDYSTKVVAGGLTQAAIDQRALGYLTSGSQPPAGRTGVGGAQAAAIANRMAEIDPSGNLTANRTVLKSLSSTLTDQTKYLNNTERAFNTANDTLANLQTYMTKNGINPSQFPDYNTFTNFLKAKGLDAGAAGGYNAQLATLRQEYSQVLAKGGVRSVETDREASQLIPDGLNPAQLAQVAAQIKIDSDNAINEAKSQVSSVTDQINGLANGSSASQPAPAAAPPPAADQQPVTKTIGNVTYTSPDGGKSWYAP